MLTLEVRRMRLLGAGAPREIRGVDALPGIANYFIGNDPARWRRSCRPDVRTERELPLDGICGAAAADWQGGETYSIKDGNCSCAAAVHGAVSEQRSSADNCFSVDSARYFASASRGRAA